MRNGETLELVTLNLGGLGKGWFGERRAVVVEGLKDVDPDLLCLHEVTVAPRGDEIYDQAWDLARALAFEHCVFDTYVDPDDVDTGHLGLLVELQWRPS